MSKDFRRKVRKDLIKNKVINENVVNLPITEGDKYKNRMRDLLLYYADLIDKGGADPQIDKFIIAISQGGNFKFGGCGQLSKSEISTLKEQLDIFISGLHKPK